MTHFVFLLLATVLCVMAAEPVNDTNPSTKFLIGDQVSLNTTKQNLLELFRPISDKLAYLVAWANHPNFGGGLQWPNPAQSLWEKLQEKGQNYLNGPAGAVFGSAIFDKHKPLDYPFAYRNKQSRSSQIVIAE